MKRMGASETRRDWFRVLDDVLAGEVVVIERRGRRVVLRAEDPTLGGDAAAVDYSAFVHGDVDRAEEWSWEWQGPESELAPARSRPVRSREPDAESRDTEAAGGDETR